MTLYHDRINPKRGGERHLFVCLLVSESLQVEHPNSPSSCPKLGWQASVHSDWERWFRRKSRNWAWWFKFVIPVPGNRAGRMSWVQEQPQLPSEFQANLSYTIRSCLNQSISQIRKLVGRNFQKRLITLARLIKRGRGRCKTLGEEGYKCGCDLEDGDRKTGTSVSQEIWTFKRNGNRHIKCYIYIYLR